MLYLYSWHLTELHHNMSSTREFSTIDKKDIRLHITILHCTLSVDPCICTLRSIVASHVRHDKTQTSRTLVLLSIWPYATFFSDVIVFKIEHYVKYKMTKNVMISHVHFQAKWTNKTRVLVLSSRGISHRSRHLMEDLKRLMPHSKSGKIKQKQIYSCSRKIKSWEFLVLF